MSIGVVGFIGCDRLAAFCLATTFRLLSHDQTNRQSANCKICGEKLQRGDGTPVAIVGKRPGTLARYYLCLTCATFVRAAIAEDGRFVVEEPQNEGGTR